MPVMRARGGKPVADVRSGLMTRRLHVVDVARRRGVILQHVTQHHHVARPSSSFRSAVDVSVAGSRWGHPSVEVDKG